MTKEEIIKFNEKYAQTNGNIFVFVNHKIIIGDFEKAFVDDPELEKQNKWRIVEMKDRRKYKETKDLKYTTIINGNDLKIITPNRAVNSFKYA